MWSPDGRSLAFAQDSRLKRIDTDGGAVRTIASPGPQMGGSWGADGRIVYSPGFGQGLVVVPASGGEPKPASRLDTARGDVAHFYPVLLPDSRHFVFVARNADPEKTSLVLGDLDSAETRVLRRSDTSAAWSPLGYLLFALEGNLLAQRFDSRKGELSGETISVAKDVDFGTDSNRGVWTTSGETLVYAHWPHDRSLAWIDRAGTVVGTLGPVADYDGLVISPDGRRVAVSMRDPSRGQNLDVWVLDAATGTTSRVTSERSDEFHPVWTPDGRSLVYTSDRTGFYDLYRRPADGGAEEKILVTRWDKIGLDIAGNGTSVLFTGSPKGTSEDLWLQPLGGGEARQLMETDRFAERSARVSPNGRHVAFASDESGRTEIYVQPLAGGPRQRISRTGGYVPAWRRDGRELFFISDVENRLMAVPIATDGAGLRVGEPRSLFAVDIPDTNAFSPEPYDVSPDGQRFLIVRRSAGDAPGLVVRLNWASGLKR
jgi:hypothetical protein